VYSSRILDTKTWVRRPRPNSNAKQRLFCFSYAGGGASLFRLWPEYLPPGIEVCPIQLPGREGRVREAPYTKLADLVQDLSEVLTPVLDIPFAIFGHSLGGLIGFELSRLLRKKSALIPGRLIVAACPAPNYPNPNAPIHQLPKQEFIESLKQMDGTPEQVFEDPMLLDFFLPLLRADFAVYETYSYHRDSPLECPISVYGGLDDVSVPVQSLKTWSEQTSRSFKIRMFPGNHYFVRENLGILLQAILDDLTLLI
jgi:medium-chain acyl-[acyl-carrier-protein] hydrolase